MLLYELHVQLHCKPIGDIVGVFSNGKNITEKLLSGIVVIMKQISVSVAFDNLPDTVDLSTYDGSLQLVKLSNDVTYRRITRYVHVYIHFLVTKSYSFM